MATRLVTELQKEIDSRRAELERLEAALEALSGGAVLGNGRRGRGKAAEETTPSNKKTRKPRTLEQKAAQAERMKQIWASKRAAASGAPAKKLGERKPSVKKPSAKKASGKKTLAKKIGAATAAPAQTE